MTSRIPTDMVADRNSKAKLSDTLGSIQTSINTNTSALAENASKIGNIATYDVSIEKLTSEPDYTLAFQRIASKIQQYETVIIPEGFYDITSEIVFSSDLDITIICRGMIRANNCSGITFQNCQRVNGNIRILNKNLDWADEIRGVTLDSCSNCTLDITYIENFKYGLVLQGLTNAGTSYNHLVCGYIKNNKYQVYLHCASGGWVTENKFYGGRFTLDSTVKSTQTGDYAIYFQRDNGATWTMDNIRFYSPCIENLHNGIYFNCTDSLLDHPRFENTDANWLSGIFVRSMFNAGVGGVDPTKINLDPASVDNIFHGKVGSTDNTITLNSQYGGLGFMNTLGDNAMLGSLQHLNLLNAMKFTDSAGQVQTFNKQYEGDGTTPTTGTYRKGSIVWNTSNLVTGQPIGQICNGTGTMGTLSGITATGTSGTNTITVNSTTGLYDGSVIVIAGSNGSKVVQNIKGTTITLSVNLDVNVSNASVSFNAATWKAMPNLP